MVYVISIFRIPNFLLYSKMTENSQVVKNHLLRNFLVLCCRGRGLDSWSGDRVPTCCVVQPKKKGIYGGGGETGST